MCAKLNEQDNPAWWKHHRLLYSRTNEYSSSDCSGHRSDVVIQTIIHIMTLGATIKRAALGWLIHKCSKLNKQSERGGVQLDRPPLPTSINYIWRFGAARNLTEHSVN